MRKSFFYCFTTAFTVIGSVIGAGFITGKELYEFFGRDFSIGGVYLAFICFWLFTYFLMNGSKNPKAEKVSDIVIALSCIIITGCMISALDEVYVNVLHLSEKRKILSVITAIFVFITSLKGVSFIEKFCSAVIPILLVALITLALSKSSGTDASVAPQTGRGIAYPFIYVGFNLLLSSKIIKTGGEKLSPPFKLLSSFIISFVLCVCIFIISNLFSSGVKDVEMPFRSMFSTNVKLLIIVDIITVFAIISTLYASLYTSITFGGVNLKLWHKILILLFSLALSEAGFSIIVERLYPILGFAGYLVICITCLLRAPSPKEQPKRTFRLLKYIK